MKQKIHKDQQIEKLLKRLCKGDREAYDQIYRLYFNQIYIFVLRYVVSEDLAYDLTQDVFLKVWERKDQLNHVNNLRAYIYRMAKNHTLDNLKRISISEKAIEEVSFHYVKQSKPLDVKYIEKEYFEFLESAIIDLPERTRIIFNLCRTEKKSYKEVAEELGISRDTVKHHMVQSMKVLKEKVISKFDIAITILLLIFK